MTDNVYCVVKKYRKLKGSLLLFNLKLKCLIFFSTSLNNSLIIFINIYCKLLKCIGQTPCSYEHYLVWLKILSDVKIALKIALKNAINLSFWCCFDWWNLTLSTNNISIIINGGKSGFRLWRLPHFLSLSLFFLSFYGAHAFKNHKQTALQSYPSFRGGGAPWLSLNSSNRPNANCLEYAR